MSHDWQISQWILSYPSWICSQVKERLRKMGTLQPLNIFLRQEVDRMQKVITEVRSTLKDLKLGIDGTIIMSENLRDALDNMYDARVPNTWKKVRVLQHVTFLYRIFLHIYELLGIIECTDLLMCVS